MIFQFVNKKTQKHEKHVHLLFNFLSKRYSIFAT